MNDLGTKAYIHAGEVLYMRSTTMRTTAVAPSSVVVSLDARVRRVRTLDLEPIKYKLVDGDGEQGWTVEKADAVEVEYKRFLELNLRNRITGQVKSVVPTRDVDKFWHAHILDTMKYPVDCEFALGFFLHHFPYLGLRGAEDAQVLKDRFRESREYYASVFGQQTSTGEASADCDTSDCAPEPSCDGAPAEKRADLRRPVLMRA